MKKILLILSFASLLLSCKGEDLSQNPNDPYKEIETLEREKEKERPHVPQTSNTITKALILPKEVKPSRRI